MLAQIDLVNDQPPTAPRKDLTLVRSADRAVVELNHTARNRNTLWTQRPMKTFECVVKPPTPDLAVVLGDAGAGTSSISSQDALSAPSIAAVFVVEVAVVAIFKTRLAIDHVGAHDPVAATRNLTSRRARVGLDGVGVVAFLAAVDHPITARGQDAVDSTAIRYPGGVTVPIVT